MAPKDRLTVDRFRLEAVVLSGIQGAGKSTFCRQWYADTHIRINYDMLRTRRREHILINACIEAKQPFVVDATNPTAIDRARYLQNAAEAGFYLVGIEFDISLHQALMRNAQRHGKAQVPEKAIRATLKRMEPLSFGEGFNEIWLAHVTADGVRLVKSEPKESSPTNLVTSP